MLARDLLSGDEMGQKQAAKIGPLGRRLLATFVGVALVPMLAALALSYWSSRQSFTDLLEENIGKTARVYADEVDDFLAEQTTLLTALAPGLKPEDESLRAVVERTAKVEELILLDGHGAVVARSQSEDSWMTDACPGTSLGLTPMQHAHHGAGHEVMVTVPSTEGGRLCGRVSFTLHQDMLSERAQSAFGGLAYIVDHDGNVVCHAFEEDEPHIHPGQPIQGPVAERAALGRHWQGVITTDHERRLAAYAPCNDLTWGVWAEVPYAEAASVLRPLNTRALLLGVSLTVLLAGVIVVVVRRIAAPIEDLAAASQRIAAGAIGETVPERGSDEIATLAREFNAMSRALAQSVRGLDAKVEERTRELDDARKFSDALLDTVDQRIVVIDENLHIIRANRAATDAYGPTVIGSQVPGNQGAHCAARVVFESNTPSSEETVRTRPDGRDEILAVDRYPVPGPDGPRAVLRIERDVTDFKQFQAHLVHQEKMAALGTLAAGLAHEIGNPLASLSSELEMLQEDPSGLDESLPVLHTQIRRMSGLLRELVQLGRTPTNTRERFSAGEVVDDVLRLLRHNAKESQLTILNEVDEGLYLCSSRDRLVQVLLNLGLNAVDASPTGGTILFCGRTKGTGVEFSVDDDGPGIVPEVRKHLFEPFFTTKAVGKGTGLGLFVVHQVVSSLGGSLEVEESPSGGARFVVVLSDCGCGESNE